MTAIRLVVDANIVISAFLRDGTTRGLLLDAPLSLYTPSWLRTEAEKRLIALAARKKIGKRQAKTLLDTIMTRIQEVPEPILAKHAREAIRRCSSSGIKDAPYVACALAIDAGIWTHDNRLASEAGVRTYTTAELRRTLR